MVREGGGKSGEERERGGKGEAGWVGEREKGVREWG